VVFLYRLYRNQGLLMSTPTDCPALSLRCLVTCIYFRAGKSPDIMAMRWGIEDLGLYLVMQLHHALPLPPAVNCSTFIPIPASCLNLNFSDSV